MNSFSITLKNELIRMTHRKKLFAGMITAAAIPLIIVAAKVLALGWNVTLIYREDLIRVALSLFTPLILPLFSIVLAADAFMDEQSRGALKTSFLMPESRTGHFMAKLTGALAGTSAMILSLWFLGAVSGLVLPSRGGWLGSLGLGLMQSLASLMPVAMVLGFSVLAAQYIKSVSGMVLSLIGLTIVLKLLPLWLGDLNRILPSAWLGYGANIGYISLSSILYALAVMALWTVFTCGLALFRFERKMI